jgi:23S rRNA (pseudouridine1915-N3)-methyltransferase
MHRIRLVSVGKIKTPWITDGCALYTERLRHSCEFLEQVIGSSSQAEEQEKVLSALEKIGGVIVVLDERGKEKTSAEFASWIGKQRDIGTEVTFVIGGAYGLSDAIRSKATLVLSLSKMTLPHELCKLFFLEQLFRAHAILAGTGYHHA